nr:DEAD/DEAH box helicase [Geodermatophilaceae bacterium]
AQTGTGKTAAFLLPYMNSWQDRNLPDPEAIVLVPTRELAQQVTDALVPLGQAMRVKVTAVYGGAPMGRQIDALKRGVDIVVATPGRLVDLIERRVCSLAQVEVAVLDEADYMADLGFLPAVRRLLDATQRHGQRMLFSATLDNGVDVLVRRYLTDALTHSVDAAATPIEPTSHHVLAVDTVEDKNAVVHELASGEGRRLLFTRTKHQAKRLARQLTAAGIPAVDLHGNLNQNARDRNLAQFATGQVSVLVATDVAARGIHVDDVRLVVHVDPPAEHKAYLHRSGRTARAGATGDVVTVMLPSQRGDVRTLARQAGIRPVIQPTRPGSVHTRELVGPAMPLRAVTMAPVAPTTSGRRKASPAGAGRRNSQLATTEAGSRHRGSPKAPGTGGRRRGTPLVAWTSNSGGAAAFSSSSRSGGRRAGR